jgi:uncharacterized damage-inducible protein DinB
MNKRIQSYIDQFNQIFNGDPWLDETFRKKVGDLTDAQVFVKSPNENHSVAEVISHLIVWRREYLRRLADDSPERMLGDESPHNWKPVDALKKEGWQTLYEDFRNTQRELIELLQDKDDSFLDELLAGTDHIKEYYLAGLLHHDVYHLGQVGLILKWVK